MENEDIAWNLDYQHNPNYFSGIACGIAYATPKEPRDLYIQSTSEGYNMYPAGNLLTRGQWEIRGSDENIREFIAYTLYSLKTDPVCQLVGIPTNVTDESWFTDLLVNPWISNSKEGDI